VATGRRHARADVRTAVDTISREGGTPLVSPTAAVLGVIHLQDVVKGGIRERFAELRRMGIRTVMITGDNKLTATAIAAEAGVDDVLAEATPEAKLAPPTPGRRPASRDGRRRHERCPALAQADIAVAMTPARRPRGGRQHGGPRQQSKLIEVVRIGKQLRMTRGSLTTFSIANDVAKYFAILPAVFAGTYPALRLDVMHLHSPQSAILSSVSSTR
jgi:K+-transporting ATPase ATPase B chain